MPPDSSLGLGRRGHDTRGAGATARWWAPPPLRQVGWGNNEDGQLNPAPGAAMVQPSTMPGLSPRLVSQPASPPKGAALAGDPLVAGAGGADPASAGGGDELLRPDTYGEGHRRYLAFSL